MLFKSKPPSWFTCTPGQTLQLPQAGTARFSACHSGIPFLAAAFSTSLDIGCDRENSEYSGNGDASETIENGEASETNENIDNCQTSSSFCIFYLFQSASVCFCSFFIFSFSHFVFFFVRM